MAWQAKITATATAEDCSRRQARMLVYRHKNAMRAAERAVKARVKRQAR